MQYTNGFILCVCSKLVQIVDKQCHSADACFDQIYLLDKYSKSVVPALFTLSMVYQHLDQHLGHLRYKLQIIIWSKIWVRCAALFDRNYYLEKKHSFQCYMHWKSLHTRKKHLENKPFSIASMSASVSLLLMQSISCRCDLSLELSNLLSPPILALDILTHALGNARRPSNNRTNNKSTSLIVSSAHLSSPWRAFSIASGRSDRRRSCQSKELLVHVKFLWLHVFCKNFINSTYCFVFVFFYSLAITAFDILDTETCFKYLRYDRERQKTK